VPFSPLNGELPPSGGKRKGEGKKEDIAAIPASSIFFMNGRPRREKKKRHRAKEGEREDKMGGP